MDKLEFEIIEQITTSRISEIKKNLLKLIDLSTNERETNKYEFAFYCVTSIEQDIRYMLGELKNGDNKIQGKHERETERA